MDDATPSVRPAARVLLLDEQDRLLLFRIAPEVARARRPVWLVPGGGVQPGETHEEAACREIWEETGLQDVELGPCIWRRSHRFTFRGREVEQREQFFVARCHAFDVVTTNMEDYEVDFLPEFRWWEAGALAESRDWFVPRVLGRHLPDLIAGRYPAEPFDVGR